LDKKEARKPFTYRLFVEGSGEISNFLADFERLSIALNGDYQV
jgi:hypothetical protein